MVRAFVLARDRVVYSVFERESNVNPYLSITFTAISPLCLLRAVWCLLLIIFVLAFLGTLILLLRNDIQSKVSMSAGRTTRLT